MFNLRKDHSHYFCTCTSGFNAAVAGCFFAIETVLRPLRAENSPPFTTAMIILASVVSSTVSNAVLGEKQAFTVPTYDLKSAAGILSDSRFFANHIWVCCLTILLLLMNSCDVNFQYALVYPAKHTFFSILLDLWPVLSSTPETLLYGRIRKIY